jgi:SAM-dependent methyltransferase
MIISPGALRVSVFLSASLMWNRESVDLVPMPLTYSKMDAGESGVPLNVSVRQVVRRSRHAVIAYHLIKNLRAGHRLAEGDIARTDFVNESDSADAKLAYAEMVFGAYRSSGGLQPDWLCGKRVLEVGHGDSFLTAMLLVMHGAANVTCLDRFDVRKNLDTEEQAYRQLAERGGRDSSKRLESALRGQDVEGVLADMGIFQIYMPIEDAAVLQPHSFDLIVSMAVLEHVSGVEAALRAMDALLSSRGQLVHGVDGIFSGGGQHPLTFLTVPGIVYEHMSKDTGAPNRERIGTYLHCLDKLGYGVRCYVTRVLGSEEDVGRIPLYEFDITDFPEARRLVAQARPRLQKPYRDLDDSTLAVTAFLLEAHRTQEQSCRETM